MFVTRNGYKQSELKPFGNFTALNKLCQTVIRKTVALLKGIRFTGALNQIDLNYAFRKATKTRRALHEIAARIFTDWVQVHRFPIDNISSQMTCDAGGRSICLKAASQ